MSSNHPQRPIKSLTKHIPKLQEMGNGHWRSRKCGEEHWRARRLADVSVQTWHARAPGEGTRVQIRPCLSTATLCRRTGGLGGPNKEQTFPTGLARSMVGFFIVRQLGRRGNGLMRPRVVVGEFFWASMIFEIRFALGYLVLGPLFVASIFGTPGPWAGQPESRWVACLHSSVDVV